MLNRSASKSSIECDVVKLNDGINQKTPYPKSIWDWEHWKSAGRSGGHILDSEWVGPNVCTDEGITHMLDVAFSGGPQKSTWYIAIFNDDYTPLITNTYQSPGYTESSNYAEASRPVWQEAGVADKALTNSANRAYFTMSASEYIYGGSLVSASTKGDSVSGEIMYCANVFSSAKDIDPDDVLKVTINLSSADS